jgi:hypothetical protein
VRRCFHIGELTAFVNLLEAAVRNTEGIGAVGVHLAEDAAVSNCGVLQKAIAQEAIARSEG